MVGEDGTRPVPQRSFAVRARESSVLAAIYWRWAPLRPPTPQKALGLADHGQHPTASPLLQPRFRPGHDRRSVCHLRARCRHSQPHRKGIFRILCGGRRPTQPPPPWARRSQRQQTDRQEALRRKELVSLTLVAATPTPSSVVGAPVGALALTLWSEKPLPHVVLLPPCLRGRCRPAYQLFPTCPSRSEKLASACIHRRHVTKRCTKLGVFKRRKGRYISVCLFASGEQLPSAKRTARPRTNRLAPTAPTNLPSPPPRQPVPPPVPTCLFLPRPRPLSPLSHRHL